jgi:hypothetical protein
MIVLRCTRKLLDRLGTPVADPPQSTSLFGDWYAKPFPVAQRRFVLLMSAATRVPVIVSARDLANLPRTFADSLQAILYELQLPPAAVQREVEASRDTVLAATDSKSMLGSLNDFAYHAQHRLRVEPDVNLVALSAHLADMPVIAMNFGFPVERARELLR